MSNFERKRRVKSKSKHARKGSTFEKWQDRVVQIRRVNKVCKGGKKLSFRAVVIIGNGNGKVGVGVGKAIDVISAIKKALIDAKRNRTIIPITKSRTIQHLNYGTYGACKVLLRPASSGTGVIAGSSIRTVLELAGIKNVLSKQLGGKNCLNNARATVLALETIKTPPEVAIARNKPLQVFYTKI
jgi:small subunit ribosomal protein S5